MTIESIHRIGVTAMVLLLVLAAAAAQTTSAPLYVDGGQRVVATFHRISEGSLPVNGAMESFGTSVYPSWPQDTQRTRTILQTSTQRFRGWLEPLCRFKAHGADKRLLKRRGPGEAYSTGQTPQAKDERCRAGEDRGGAECPLGEDQEGGEIKRPLQHLRAWLTKPASLQ
jgi:hypothetical protein